MGAPQEGVEDKAQLTLSNVDAYPQLEEAFPMEATASALLNALGVEDTQDDDLEEICQGHPTVRAFVNGELTFAEAIFVENYLANGFNLAKAARAAKYKSVTSGGYSTIGSSVVNRPRVKKILAQRLREKAMDADEILARYRDVADASVEDFFEVNTATGGATLDLTKAAERNKLHLVKRLKYDKEGGLNIELRDQDHALDQLARNLGVFKADAGVNVPPEILELLKLTPEQSASKLQAYDDMEDWGDDAGLEQPRGEADESDPAEDGTG